MIEKIIHFCWLSNEPYPDDIRNCIESWKRYMPEYEIRLWDTKRFDVCKNRYVKQAFERNKYAFVSDYVRLYALYYEGGIYLDSDIEVFKSFNPLLNNKAFTGFEGGGRIAAWLMASQKGNPLFKEMLDYYEDRDFVTSDGRMDLTPNTIPMTNILIKHGLSCKCCYQHLRSITVYPEDYFCPKNPWTNQIHITRNTYAMHLFKGAWNHLAKEENDLFKNIDIYVFLFLRASAIHKYNEMYIYGAGTVGMLVLDQLRYQRPQLRVKAFVVTNPDNTWKMVSDIPIISINDILDKNALILVATTSKYQEQIKSELIRREYKYIYCIGEQL